MKNANTFKMSALLTGLLVLGSLSACCEKPASTPPQNIVESTTIVGLWQKQKEVAVEDVDGNQLTALEGTDLYKCVAPDGTFFLFRAATDAEGRERSRVELYGTYVVSSDSVCTEVITTHCLRPTLSGITSELHFVQPSSNELNVWYNLKSDDGTSGSNEWVPEIWHRVGAAVN